MLPVRAFADSIKYLRIRTKSTMVVNDKLSIISINCCLLKAAKL